MLRYLGEYKIYESTFEPQVNVENTTYKCVTGSSKHFILKYCTRKNYKYRTKGIVVGQRLTDERIKTNSISYLMTEFEIHNV